MHLTRQEISTKIPIPRKGTKYVVRALSDIKNSVPVLIAVRDMLKLARTLKEVKGMIKSKLIKINSRDVKDFRESIKLFNILQIGNSYVLTLLPTGRFALEKFSGNERLCKITGKNLLPAEKIQFNLHDGTNLISSEKFVINDSLYLDFSGKVKKHVSLEKGRDVFVMSGKYLGLKGKINSIKNKVASLKISGKEESVELPAEQIIAL